MATSIGIITILGLIANSIFTKLKLPGLLGMLIVGIIIGPFGLNWLTQDLLNVSGDFRKIALIIILLRAGLGISRNDLNKVGSTAIKLSCIPGIIEGFTIAIISMFFLDFSFIEGGILGFIIAAVSPAVVVPQMLYYQQKGIGTNKGIPTLILASASIDDVFAITIFTAFLGLYSGNQINIGVQLLNIPISIVLGIGVGIIAGLLLVRIFTNFRMRDTKKVLYILAISILLTAIETALKSKIEIAGLLGVMTIGFIILERKPEIAKRLSMKFDKIWLFAEILLFVLVAAQVNISVALKAGGKGFIIIIIGLLGRSLGVWLSTMGTKLNNNERLFCIISYIPKATVQAAIGAIPLSLGVESGETMLAIAVLSILLTAPLGAVAIKAFGKRLLTVQSSN
jgi:NhaP-type Na+/H+ or K+/H+ antiporter